MCQYCHRVMGKIMSSHPIGYWINNIKLMTSYKGDIKYTKVSKKTRKSYSKVIPINSLHLAKQIADTRGINSVNRKWHNGLPEGRSRPCNLKVIESILMNIH